MHPRIRVNLLPATAFHLISKHSSNLIVIVSNMWSSETPDNRHQKGSPARFDRETASKAIFPAYCRG
jgi:hypothetical protein